MSKGRVGAKHCCRISVTTAVGAGFGIQVGIEPSLFIASLGKGTANHVRRCIGAHQLAVPGPLRRTPAAPVADVQASLCDKKRTRISNLFLPACTEPHDAFTREIDDACGLIRRRQYAPTGATKPCRSGDVRVMGTDGIVSWAQLDGRSRGTCLPAPKESAGPERYQEEASVNVHRGNLNLRLIWLAQLDCVFGRTARAKIQ
jgi:hypothetical protein